MPKNTVRNIIIILGPPGSGKGTQGKLLAAELDYGYVSMGQVLRSYASRDTELGQRIKELIDSGVIIPDEWMRVVFHEVMMEIPAKPGVILDGFPRDISQEDIFEDSFKEFNIQKVTVLFLDVPEKKLVERINQRGTTESRADDDPNIIHTRFAEYEKKTLPLRKYYEDKGYLIRINGDRPIAKVQEDIKRAMGL